MYHHHSFKKKRIPLNSKAHLIQIVAVTDSWNFLFSHNNTLFTSLFSIVTLSRRFSFFQVFYLFLSTFYFYKNSFLHFFLKSRSIKYVTFYDLRKPCQLKAMIMKIKHDFTYKFINTAHIQSRLYRF